MKMPLLRKGDSIAIAAPARSISREQLANAEEYIGRKGYKLYYEKDLFTTEHQFGGSDVFRADFFNRLLAEGRHKVIWCARGGYGSLRMVDGLNTALLKAAPKWIAGFSDITILHSHIARHCGIPTLHSTMPVFMNEKTGNDYSDAAAAIDSMLSVLEGTMPVFDLRNNLSINAADFEGKITGGNLSVLASIAGSESEFCFDDQILFIEDLDEYFYHIDRLMLMFKRSGRLSKLKALLVGSFIQMHDHTIPFGKNVREIITEHCSSYGYPIIFDVDAGHHLHNMAIPFGISASYRGGILTFAG